MGEEKLGQGREAAKQFLRDHEAVAKKITTLVPEARVAVGHGQMASKELESVMKKFIPNPEKNKNRVGSWQLPASNQQSLFCEMKNPKYRCHNK